MFLKERYNWYKFILFDATPLLEDARNNKQKLNRSFGQRNRVKCVFLVILLILAITALTLYFLLTRCSILNKCVNMTIMSLNTLGMPKQLGSEFKTERMNAIAKEVSKGHFDLYLLQGLWMEQDHSTIAEMIPDQYSMKGFRDLSTLSCDGRVLPIYCSGLAIISKYPFKEIEFNSFADHGDQAKMFEDFEWFLREGVGRVQVEPLQNILVDIFVTETAADPDRSRGYNNSYYRKRQVRELMNKRISKSTDDLVVLGGDFNAGPEKHDGSVYEMVRSKMRNCIEEIYHRMDEWLNPRYATYGNPSNTFSGNKTKPVIYDYIFRRTNLPEKITPWTSTFDVPLFKTRISKSLLLSRFHSKYFGYVIGKDIDPLNEYNDVHNTDKKENRIKTYKQQFEKSLRETDMSHYTPSKDYKTTLISFSDHEASHAQ